MGGGGHGNGERERERIKYSSFSPHHGVTTPLENDYPTLLFLLSHTVHPPPRRHHIIDRNTGSIISWQGPLSLAEAKQPEDLLFTPVTPAVAEKVLHHAHRPPSPVDEAPYKGCELCHKCFWCRREAFAPVIQRVPRCPLDKVTADDFFPMVCVCEFLCAFVSLRLVWFGLALAFFFLFSFFFFLVFSPDSQSAMKVCA
jgi:hypothetical protein